MLMIVELYEKFNFIRKLPNKFGKWLYHFCIIPPSYYWMKVLIAPHLSSMFGIVSFHFLLILTILIDV